MSQANQPDGTGFTGGLYMKKADGTYQIFATADGAVAVDTPVVTTDLTTTGDTILGNNAVVDTLTVDSVTAMNGVTTFNSTVGFNDLIGFNAAATFQDTVDVGADGTGYDVNFFGATASKKWMWDESADKVILAGDQDITGNSQFTGTVTVGVDDTGHDVQLFGATTGKSWLWDESADKMIVTGDSDLLGVTQQTGTFTVGVDDTGHDVKFFGATSGMSLLWDESADKLIVTGTADVDGTLTILSGRGIASSVATALGTFILAAAMDNTTDTAAVSVTNYYTTLTTTGAAVPTLADGGVVGQLKKIEMLVDAGNAVLTPTNLKGGTTITFADVGDVAELIWDGNDWVAIALYNTVDGATAPTFA